MSDREPVNLGYPYVESFYSDFSGTGGVDQTDRSTNIDEHTIEEMHQIASRYPDSCLLYTSPSPRDQRGSRMPSSA